MHPPAALWVFPNGASTHRQQLHLRYCCPTPLFGCSLVMRVALDHLLYPLHARGVQQGREERTTDRPLSVTRRAVVSSGCHMARLGAGRGCGCSLTHMSCPRPPSLARVCRQRAGLVPGHHAFPHHHAPVGKCVVLPPTLHPPLELFIQIEECSFPRPLPNNNTKCIAQGRMQHIVEQAWFVQVATTV